MIQLRNVPDELHRKLKSRAAFAGMSLSEYLLREVRTISQKPTLEEMRERLAKLPPVDFVESSVDIIRQERDRS